MNMKKMLAVGATALCATVGFAELASANVVGYTTSTLEADKWYLIGCNFEKVGTGNLSIQDLVSGLEPASDPSVAPTIQYWDGAKLVTLSYLDFVWDPNAGEGGDFVVGWADPTTIEAVSFDANPGFGCWIKLPTTATITCSGQVVDTDSAAREITSAWSLVSCPYPSALQFNSSKFDCTGLTASSDVATAPTIQYWDGSKLVSLSYSDFVWSDAAADFVVGWTDPSTMEYFSVALPPCTGFWIKSSNGGSINFVK